MPERVQLSRLRGWRMPENTVKVDRTTRWGNPIRVGGEGDRTLTWGGAAIFPSMPTREAAIEYAVRAFRWQLLNHPNVIGFTAGDVRRELAGRNLACWCAPGTPCHADVLLELANGDPE